MPRTITYYYPDENNPSAIKVFQDRSSQIRGFYFKRDYLKDVAKEDYAPIPPTPTPNRRTLPTCISSTIRTATTSAPSAAISGSTL